MSRTKWKVLKREVQDYPTFGICTLVGWEYTFTHNDLVEVEKLLRARARRMHRSYKYNYLFGHKHDALSGHKERLKWIDRQIERRQRSRSSR